MPDATLQIIAYSGLTILLYLASKWWHRRQTVWWNAPMLTGPAVLVLLAFGLHINCRQYAAATHWLTALFAPATVAFAIPIYEQRALIRRHWPLLLAGAIIGSITAMASSWGLATLIGLNHDLRASLLPRSISTPFAMVVSGNIGGEPSVTALFVLLTGIWGAAIGESLLAFLPLRSALARGTLFGMGAHAFGTAKACEIHPEIGAIAGLVMVGVGVLNVLASPLLAHWLR